MRCHYLVISCLVFASGCGGTNIVPVSGRVTLDGKPLVNGTIIFQPLSEEKNPGPGSRGKTDGEGKFTMQLMTGNKPGALVGSHRVSVTAYEGDDSIPSSGSDMKFRKLLVHEDYNAKSKLTVDVPAGGTTEANIEVFSTPAK
jgi:hypothetical protein